MKFSFHQETFLNILRQRNFSYVVSAGLLLICILLSCKVFIQDERWVLMPQFEPANKMTVQGSVHSSVYLEHWAGGILQELLTANPHTIDAKTIRILEISATSFGQIRPVLDAKAKTIKENRGTTSFYPKKFEVFQDKKEVVVTGTFMTWFGKDKPPIVETIAITLGWSIGPRGVLLVRSFEERKQI